MGSADLIVETFSISQSTVPFYHKYTALGYGAILKNQQYHVLVSSAKAGLS